MRLPATGSLGPRYMLVLDQNGTAPLVAGDSGAVAVAESFQGSKTIAGVTVTGHAAVESYALLWFDPAGTPGTHGALELDPAR